MVAGGIMPAAPKTAGKKTYLAQLRGYLLAMKYWNTGKAKPMNQNQFTQEYMLPAPNTMRGPWTLVSREHARHLV